MEKKSGRRSNDKAKEALREINDLARKFRVDEPGMKWTDAIKKASAEYRKSKGLPEKAPRNRRKKRKPQETAESKAVKKEIRELREEKIVKEEMPDAGELTSDEMDDLRKAMKKVRMFEKRMKLK